MWSSKARALGIFAALAAPLALAGCSGLTPVYGTNSITSDRIEIAYAEPHNRLEQVIYQDLRLRIAKANGPAPRLIVDASQSSSVPTNSIVTTAQGPVIVRVSANITLVDEEGKVLFTGNRAQTADYNSGPQVVANTQAADDAAKRAAHLLADTIRLTILGALAK
ncbi:MAG: LPS assembly lipoprotein LptE [Devosia sp.]